MQLTAAPIPIVKSRLGSSSVLIGFWVVELVVASDGFGVSGAVGSLGYTGVGYVLSVSGYSGTGY